MSRGLGQGIQIGDELPFGGFYQTIVLPIRNAVNGTPFPSVVDDRNKLGNGFFSFTDNGHINFRVIL